MKRKFGFLVVLLTLFFALGSQNKYDKAFYLIDIGNDFVFDPVDKHDVDSILKLYHGTENDTLKMYYLRVFSEGLTNEYLWTRYNRYLYKYSLAGDDSLYKFYQACAINNIGYEAQYIKNDLESAKKNYQESYELFKEIKNGSGLGVEINNLAYLYQHEGNIQKSVELYTEAGKLFEKLNQPLGLTSVYINLGDIYFDNDEFEKAEEFFNKALGYAIQTDQKPAIANAYNQLGVISSNKNNTIKAIEYFKKALAIYEKDNNYNKQALVSLGLCNVYNKIKEEKQFEYYVLNAYNNSLLSPDMQVKSRVYDHVALLYLTKKDFKKAQIFADSAYVFAKKLAYPELKANAAQKLSDIYRHAGKYDLAYRYLSEAKSIQDSIRTDATKKSIIKSQFQLEYNKKAIELKAEQDKKDAIRKNEKRQQQIILTLTLIALTAIAVFAFIAFKNYRKTKKQNLIIEQQRHEVIVKNEEVTRQKALVEEKQKEIIDSITYAKRLQEAILPPQKFINTYLPDNFILYRPKDLVAGDFYWAEKVNDLFFIAAADSTGHGVPGALVSVVCSNALNRSLKEFGLRETGKILDKTRELVLETFDRSDFAGEKNKSEVKDGMDISLLCVDLKNKRILWSGANNPLWYVYDNTLIEIKADKQPIGKTEYPKPFTTHEIEYRSNTTFYLFTDGFADQFGGPSGKKFKYKQLSDLLLKNVHLQQKEQFSLIENAFSNWKGDLEQVDDVCVIGIKI